MTSDRELKRVAIIDSGAGALSVTKEIVTRGLAVELIYVADRAFYPYGILSDQTLIERTEYLVDKLHRLYTPDLIILACNTASTLTLPTLRSRWSTPIIGVVPAIKPAAKVSINKKIAVLATDATVERDYLSQLIKDHASDTVVICHGSQKLVELAENYLLNNEIDELAIETELSDVLNKSDNIDQLVLACTHFPILKPQIERILIPKGISVVDSTAAIANRLESLLPQIASLSLKAENYKSTFISTAAEKLVDYSRYVFSGANPDCEYETFF